MNVQSIINKTLDSLKGKIIYYIRDGKIAKGIVIDIKEDDGYEIITGFENSSKDNIGLTEFFHSERELIKYLSENKTT